MGDFPGKWKGNGELSTARMLCQSLSGKISSYGVPSHIAGSAARIIRYLAYLLIIRKDLKVSRSCVCIRVATLSTPYSFFFFLIHSLCLRSVTYFCSPAFYVTVCNEQAIFNLKKKKSGIESIFCFQKKLDHSCYLCLVCSESSPVTEIQQALSNIEKNVSLSGLILITSHLWEKSEF